MGPRRPRRPTARPRAGSLPRRHLRSRRGVHRRGDAALGGHDVAALPPGRRRPGVAQRGAHPRRRRRPHPRRRRRLPSAGGQRPGAVRRLLRHDESPCAVGGAARGVRRPSHPAGVAVLPGAARRAAQVRTVRRQRPDRRRAHAGRLQLGLLRAHAAGPHDGCRARRGPRPGVPIRPRHDAHHPWPGAGARHLSSYRRRVPRPRPVPGRLRARRPGHRQRRSRRARHHRQRRGQRRGRRQAALHLRARPRPLLPVRGTDPAQRRHLADGRHRPPRGSAGPARRARAQAGRRLGRQGDRHRPGREHRRARRAARQDPRRPARLDRPARRLALDRADPGRERHPAATRRPAPVRRARRRRRVGAARRPHPRRPAGGRADRQLQSWRRVQGHLGDGRPRRRGRRAQPRAPRHPGRRQAHQQIPDMDIQPGRGMEQKQQQQQSRGDDPC